MITRPCTLITRSGDTVDTYGDQTKTAVETDTFCELQPVRIRLTGTEIEGGNIGTNSYHVYLPGTISPNADDALRIDGEVYEFINDASPRRNPRTQESMFTQGLVRRLRNA
jgi:hypothetical protein